MVRKSGKNWEKYFILEKNTQEFTLNLCFTKEKEERVVIYLQHFPLFSKWCHQESNVLIQSPNLQHFNIFGKIPEPLNQPYAKFTNFR